jgi:anti-sigma regulatory factor (Ser/Thr protein kinase)
MTDQGEVQLKITSEAKCLPTVRAKAEAMAEREGFPDGDAHGLALAVDEALANVIKHGYEGRPNQPIEVTLRPVRGGDGRRGISVTVRDRGRQVDPQKIRGRNLDDVRPGGLGVHIIRTVMDECEYSCPAEGGMLLRMVKYAGQRVDQPDGDEVVTEGKG